MALSPIQRIRRRHAEKTASRAAEVRFHGRAAVPAHPVSRAALRNRTRLRRNFVAVASVCHLLSWIFLILVVIGNTYNRPVLNDVYFFRLVLADIIPLSVPNASLINSVAQTLGLHDFYQVGLWTFCEGYNNEGVTYCSPPQTLYWFNPVAVILSELLAGATIALPAQVVQILDILRLVSNIMFGFFITGTVLTFVLVFASAVALHSRWWSLLFAPVAGLTALFVVGASVIGTVISLVFKYAAESQSDLNIHADVGTKMTVFMWLASAFAILAFVVHAGMGCCCTSRRDVQTGRKGGKVRERTAAESNSS